MKFDDQEVTLSAQTYQEFGEGPKLKQLLGHVPSNGQDACFVAPVGVDIEAHPEKVFRAFVGDLKEVVGKPMGRPKVPADQKLKPVTVRLTDGQREKLQAIEPEKLRAFIDGYPSPDVMELVRKLLDTYTETKRDGGPSTVPYTGRTTPEILGLWSDLRRLVLGDEE